MSTDTPRFNHDCGSCSFLGQATLPFNHSDPADVYVCPQDDYPTVVFRYSAESSDYHSYPVSILSTLAQHAVLAVEDLRKSKEAHG